MIRKSNAHLHADHELTTLQSNTTPVQFTMLSFFCGKMGAGKSTAAARIAARRHALLLAEDEWLASLYPQQITTIDEYRQCAARLKPLLKPLIQKALIAGVDVVMDFPGNTPAQRRWLLSLATEIDAQHELIYLPLSDEQCLKQIARRRQEQPERAAFDTEAVFASMARHFVAPSAAEGLNIVLIDRHFSNDDGVPS